MQVLNSKALKVTVVLDPGELAKLPDPGAVARTVLHIRAGGQSVSADIASKALRKVKATIAELGVEGVAVIMQGKLQGEHLAEAGLVCQPKAPAAAKPQAA